MQDQAVIPAARTAVPISVDGIVDSLDQLAVALGPNGANAHGALSDFVASSAHAFGGDGAALHSTLTSLGTALGALSSKSPQLTALFDNLGNLSHVASQYTGTYQAFANNLAVVSTELASDDGDIGSALANLQTGLGSAGPVHQRRTRSALGDSVTNLDAFAGAVATKQHQLAQVYAALPMALNNITQAVDPAAPGGPALRARLRPDERLGRVLPVGVRQRAAAAAPALDRPVPGQGSRRSTSAAGSTGCWPAFPLRRAPPPVPNLSLERTAGGPVMTRRLLRRTRRRFGTSGGGARRWWRAAPSLLGGCALSLQSLPKFSGISTGTYPVQAVFANVLNLPTDAQVRDGAEVVGQVGHHRHPGLQGRPDPRHQARRPPAGGHHRPDPLRRSPGRRVRPSRSRRRP